MLFFIVIYMYLLLIKSNLEENLVKGYYFNSYIARNRNVLFASRV